MNDELLTERQVRARFHKLLRTSTQAEVGRLLGVSRQIVNQVARGRSLSRQLLEGMGLEPCDDLFRTIKRADSFRKK